MHDERPSVGNVPNCDTLNSRGEKNVSTVVTQSYSNVPQEAESLLLFLLEQGSKSEAVRLYRDETGVSWSEAKGAVERLACHHGIISDVLGTADLVALGLILGSLALGFVIH
jgi:hypothetical protein